MSSAESPPANPTSQFLTEYRPSESFGPPPPAILEALGPSATFAWDEFFSGQLRNRHTRAAYEHAVRRFLNWLEPLEPNICRVSPGLVGQYLDQLPLAIPTKKLQLAALRRFFDLLVQRHVVVLNPALSVRTERYRHVEGKTPEISIAEAQQLLAAIASDSPHDLRDRAILSTLVYTAARVGAVARLTLRDFRDDALRPTLQFHEKGGKQRSIPVRADLRELLLRYLAFVDTAHTPRDAPLFRALTRRGELSDRGLTAIDMCRMMKSRLRAAGLPDHFSPHSLRVATITDLLRQRIPFEEVQYLAGHSDARTTRLYNRTQQQVSRNLVERISV